MRGKLCIVTGANSGIGKAMATAFARDGAEVLLVCRNQARGEAAVAEIARATGNDAVRLAVCDVGSQASVRAFAATFRATGRRIDVLANNAGIYLPARRVSPEGHEMMLAVNHLGPFLMTNLLLDRLEGARVVTTSSLGHAMARLDLDDLDCARRFNASRQYGLTKLANILFTRELARRTRERGVIATCFHPGAVATEFAQDEPGFLGWGIRVARWFLRTPERGAACGIFLATAPESAVPSGSYCVDGTVRTPWFQGTDDALAARLWAVSERLTGLAA